MKTKNLKKRPTKASTRVKNKKQKTKNSVTFLSIARSYLNNRVVTKSYASNVIKVAKDVKFLTTESINNYLKKRLETIQASTVRSHRTILLGLWKYAYENDLIDHMPKNIIKIKIKRKPTKAWTIKDCEDLVQKTFEKDNTYLKNGTSIGKYLRCWILLGYESGARRGDIFNFKFSNLDNNILSWTMSKTGDPMTKVLSEKTIQSINDLQIYNTKNDDRILGWVLSKRRSLTIIKQHIIDCGLSGTSKFLRRSGATHIEIDKPGYAKFHLGHRTSGLAEKNYIDFSQITSNIPQTPRLL